MERSTDLFRGSLVRLAAQAAEDAPAVARWSEDAEYLRQVDTDWARPATAAAVSVGWGAPGDGGSVAFHLRTLADDRLIGFAALHSIEWNNGTAMFSIGIGEREYRGRGYGADALRLILRYAFDELNLYRVGLHVIGDNARAIRAYERAGFRREGVIRGQVHRDGRRVDGLLMGILGDEWRQAQGGGGSDGD